MKCWHCNSRLVWVGDHDSVDENWSMETVLSCPKCDSMVRVYYPRRDDD